MRIVKEALIDLAVCFASVLCVKYLFDKVWDFEFAFFTAFGITIVWSAIKVIKHIKNKRKES